MKTRIQALLQHLNQGLVERENVLKLSLLTALAGENIVIVGPPGTGKSLVARRIAQCLAGNDNEGSEYFEYLLTKFSTPEELFGPLSISALKADRFHRNTDGYLPAVHMAFLDEIFKASSSILNALLTILNERVYHNGTQVQKVPLQALIAASNELPTDQEELGALYDRFLVRVFVDYVGAQHLPLLFSPTTEPELRAADRITPAELDQIRRAAAEVAFPPELIQAVQDIWAAHKEAFKEDRRESLSDRRLKKLIHLLQISAATNGRQPVDLSDLMLLKDCLWNHADNAAKVRELVLNTLRCHSRKVPVEQLPAMAQQPSPPEQTRMQNSDGKLSLGKSAANEPTTAACAKGIPNALIKGYSGRGTPEDPLLIQSVQDLMDLARPDVGQKSYYFKQTTSLDISTINTWPEIQFIGHYDGAGSSIRFKKPSSSGLLLALQHTSGLVQNTSNTRTLFKQIGESNIKGLAIYGCNFADRITNNSVLKDCKSTVSLANYANASKIICCETNHNIIANGINGCEIIGCRTNKSISRVCSDSAITLSHSNGTLIELTATKSLITDCAVTFTDESTDRYGTGISGKLINSTVERCIVSGNLNGDLTFSGISSIVTDSSIDRCAIGNIKINTNSEWKGRVAFRISGQSNVHNNISIDKNNSPSGYCNGESIDSTIFNQRYFEITLGWDFNSTWMWDIVKNVPTLRQIDTDALQSNSSPPKNSRRVIGRSVDLLSHQISLNIWL